jgi:hypothetical protein
MMLLPDKKKTVSVIVDKISPEKKPEEKMVEENPQSDYSAAKEDASKRMIQAFESKDAKMLSSALQDFMDMCEMEEDESEME